MTKEIAARRITSEEIAMLLDAVGQPKPKAERRVFPIKHKGRDKPINHDDRRCK